MESKMAKLIAKGLLLQQVERKQSEVNEVVWETMHKGALKEYNEAYSEYLDKFVEDNRQELESGFILKLVEDGLTQEEAELKLQEDYGLFMQYVSDTVTI